MAAGKNEREHGVFRKDACAADGPNKSGPIPFHVMELAEHAAAPVVRVVRRDPDRETQKQNGETARKGDGHHALPPLKAGRRALAAARAAAGEAALLSAGQCGAIGREAIGMSRRDAVFGRDPLRFEQGIFGEAHENRIERAGFEAGFAAKLVAVAPGSGALDEAFEDAKGLRG